MTDHCDHKFVDSNVCLKCGWTPPLLNIVRVETEPPDYQADVIMGVGYFRMPSEEAMSDDLQASAAWQDVKRLKWPMNESPWLWYYSAKDVEHARAADAQQIAALREDLRRRDETITLLMGRVEDLEGRIGNALA